jgi:hypothetical protein
VASSNSQKLPASGPTSKIALVKFLDPDTEGAIRDFLARIPAEYGWIGQYCLALGRAENTGRIATRILYWSSTNAATMGKH